MLLRFLVASICIFSLYSAELFSKETTSYQYCNAFFGLKKCIGISKGDVLVELESHEAAIYCDKDFPIIEESNDDDHYRRETTCIYNGKPIKPMKEYSNK